MTAPDFAHMWADAPLTAAVGTATGGLRQCHEGLSDVVVVKAQGQPLERSSGMRSEHRVFRRLHAPEIALTSHTCSADIACAHADPLAAAVGAAKAGFKPVPRVGSNARLGEDGGSGAQLILGFAIKVSLLGAVVFALVNYDLPVHVRNFVYGEPLYDGCCSCELCLQRP